MVRLGRDNGNIGCIIVGNWGTGPQETSGRVPRTQHRIIPPKGKETEAPTPMDSTLVKSSLLETFPPWHSQAEFSPITREYP